MKNHDNDMKNNNDKATNMRTYVKTCMAWK